MNTTRSSTTSFEILLLVFPFATLTFLDTVWLLEWRLGIASAQPASWIVIGLAFISGGGSYGMASLGAFLHRLASWVLLSPPLWIAYLPAMLFALMGIVGILAMSFERRSRTLSSMLAGVLGAGVIVAVAAHFALPNALAQQNATPPEDVMRTQPSLEGLKRGRDAMGKELPVQCRRDGHSADFCDCVTRAFLALPDETFALFAAPIDQRTGGVATGVPLDPRAGAVANRIYEQCGLVRAPEKSGAGPNPAPPLSPEELSVVSKVTGQALTQQLTKKDLARIREVYESYKSRTGFSWTKEQAEAMSSVATLIYEYNRELGRCILQSIDNGHGQPFVSNQYLMLRDKMERTGYVRKTKLNDDQKKIIAAANRTTWVDEFGARYAAPTRDDVMTEFKHLDMVKVNLDTLSAEFLALASNN